MVDCKKYVEEIKKLEEKLGDDERYANILITDEEGIQTAKETIKAAVGDIDDELLECLTFKKVSLGSLTPLLFDDNLEEIMVIGRDSPAYVFDRTQGMIASDIYINEEDLEHIIKKIARFSGRVVDPDNPLLDGRLPDGSRVNATLKGVTPRGTTMTIRKFRREPLTIIDLIKSETLSSELAAFLWLAIEGLGTKPANMLLIGGTASGKTTTMNAATLFIPRKNRILTIEDTMEISLLHTHWIPMETKPPDPGSKNEITMDDLLKNALRMRPDRMIVGEVRSSEALTLFTAMNTGHEGCMATLHANSAREALSRLQSHPMNVPDMMITALDLIVCQNRQLEGGKLVRRMSEVAEISGREGDTFLMNTLFEYDPTKGEIVTKLLNGKIVQELSELTGFSVKEIDDEINKRKSMLEAMTAADLNQDMVFDIVQTYYEQPDEALEKLYQLTVTSSGEGGSPET